MSCSCNVSEKYYSDKMLRWKFRESVSTTHSYIFKFLFLHFLPFENKSIFLNVANPKMIKSHRHRLCLMLKELKFNEYLFGAKDCTKDLIFTIGFNPYSIVCCSIIVFIL